MVENFSVPVKTVNLRFSFDSHFRPEPEDTVRSGLALILTWSFYTVVMYRMCVKFIKKWIK